MTLNADLNVWYRVLITLYKLDATSYKTIVISNRRFDDSTYDIYPLLNSIEGLALVAGQSGMPVLSTGSIEVIDSPNSFGFERRFSDQFQNYTIIDQSVEIQMTRTEAYEAPSSFTTVWKGVCKSVAKSFSEESETLSLELEGANIPLDQVSKVVDIAEWPEAPGISVGKHLPLVFGSGVIVPAIPLTKIGSEDDEASYAFASMRDTFPLDSSLFRVYGKCHDGQFRRLYSRAYNSAWGATNTTGANAPTSYGKQESAVRIIHTGVQYYAVLSGEMLFKGQNNGGITPTGDLIFRLYINEDANTGTILPDNEPVATARVSKSDYLTEVRGASDFYVKFSFANPFFYGGDAAALPPLKNLWVSLAQDTFATSATDFTPGSVTSTGDVISRDTNGLWTQPATQYKPLVQLYCAQFVPTYLPGNDPDGNGMGQFYVYSDTPGTGQTQTELSEWELLIETNGWIDDGGAVTPTVGGLMSNPQHIAEAVCWSWNTVAATFEPNDIFDFDHFQSAYNTAFSIPVTGDNFRRSIVGNTDGELNLEQFLTDLTREAMLQLVQLNSGKFAFYPEGAAPGTSVKTYDDENSKVIGYRILDSSSVVNRIKVAFDRRYINRDLEGGIPEGFAEYLEYLDISRETDSEFEDLVGVSRDIFGTKDNDVTVLNLISEVNDVGRLIRLRFRKYDKPHFLASIEVDHWDNRSIELMDIVTLSTPKLPAFLGTSSRPAFPDRGDSEVVTLTGGYEKRVEEYRCQVVGKEPRWTAETAPTILLHLRIVSPYHENEIT